MEETLALGMEKHYYFKIVAKKQEMKKYKSWFNVKPSPPVPLQSSKMIGWRHGNSLEIAGPLFVSNKDTMTPQGRMLPESYLTIVLG